MAISCGSCQEFLRWKKYNGRGLCTLKDSSTTADNNYAKKCEFFKKSKYIKQRQEKF